MLHYYNGDFPFADRFDPKLGDETVFLPEWGLAVHRQLNGFVCDTYSYEADGRFLYGESAREYAFLTGSPCAFLPDTYLYDDVSHVFYWHLYWGGRHYAVSPRLSEDFLNEAKRIEVACGAETFRFFGYAVTAFEGEEAWRQEWRDCLTDGHQAYL